jgi:hypothetical protein
MITYAHILQT